LVSFFAFPLFAQKEKLKDIYCSWGDITHFLEKENIYKDIFKDSNNPDMEKAETAAWSAFNYAFALEGLPHGLISEIFEPSVLENINKGMGVIGNSLAALQIVTDYSNGDHLKAVSGATKTSMFYAVGKWGWKSLKIAGVGLQVFDYMLTSFGEMAVSARQKAFRDAYFDYYRNTGKRDLKTWKTIIEKLEGQAAVQNEINNYLDKYGKASALDKKISGGLITKKEVAAVKKEYLDEELLPYLNSLFLVLQKNARNETLNKIANEYNTVYDKIIRELNSKRRYKIYLNAEDELIPMCKAGIEVKNDGTWKLYVKGDFNDKGQRLLSFTKYSLLVNEVDSARAVLRYEAAEGRQTYYQAIDLNKDKMDVYFELTEDDAPEEEPETTEEEAPKEKKVAQEEIPEQDTPENIIEDIQLTHNMKALLTINMLPMDVGIKKIKDTSTQFVGNIVNKKFPKKNTLTINKATREMTLIYKLAGPFAPELICRGIPITPNSYSGIITTNDKNTVNVGTFSLVLLAK
ncbi:MAG: hypothetical protein U9O95_02515, partial [Candidatus Marinimicrobia bacterium]|nr:hypothetical protein [Candidatus Neomarinimicrobiota bacterium]